MLALILFNEFLINVTHFHKTTPWNNPYHQKKIATHTIYSFFAEPPKTLDPARAYSTDEALFIGQIYEPPLQYHYLKRPYQLEPLTASAMPYKTYLDQHFKPLKNQSSPKTSLIAYTAYDIFIKPHIFYQPHPAFKATSHQAKRELTAEDYVYEIKRLASPQVNSPIFSLMTQHIVGMASLAKQLNQAYQKLKHHPYHYLDLRHFHFKGAQVISRYHYRIFVKKSYPQLNYWLAMPFFSPIPWEVEKFYALSSNNKKQQSLDWDPIGTGPYQLTENNPAQRMVLEANPYFHSDDYPQKKKMIGTNSIHSKEKRLPLTKRWVFTLDKESITRWYKFLQGYYDQSIVGSDHFNQAIHINKNQAQLSDMMKKKDIQLQTDTATGIFFTAFNMQDPIIGGYTKSARKLRQAISIALNEEEFIAIFQNGSGMAAQGPLPPGVFGYTANKQGINPYIYDWKDGMAVRKPLSFAKKLLAEAGYAHGKNPLTGKPLLLYYDIAQQSPDDKAHLDWLRKQFAQLGISLIVRSSQYNRFQEKVRTGHVQLFSYGWLADYPDPENFLFLFYGKNASTPYQGMNISNYQNKNFDRLFDQMKAEENTPKRFMIIQKMLAILRKDNPWSWGFYPKTYQLTHSWRSASKPNALARNFAKYIAINPNKRLKAQIAWNQPNTPILYSIMLIILALCLAARYQYFRYLRQPILQKRSVLCG